MRRRFSISSEEHNIHQPPARLWKRTVCVGTPVTLANVYG